MYINVERERDGDAATSYVQEFHSKLDWLASCRWMVKGIIEVRLCSN